MVFNEQGTKLSVNPALFFSLFLCHHQAGKWVDGSFSLNHFLEQVK